MASGLQRLLNSGWWALHRDQPVHVANLVSIAIDEGSLVVE
jgi:hypothetical protein